MNFSEIYEGWRNNLIPPKKLKKQIQRVSRERLEICRNCEFNSKNAEAKGFSVLRPDEHCTNCGCTLAAKTKCLHCSCPLKKWEGVISEEQSQEIQKQLP